MTSFFCDGMFGAAKSLSDIAIGAFAQELEFAGSPWARAEVESDAASLAFGCDFFDGASEVAGELGIRKAAQLGDLGEGPGLARAVVRPTAAVVLAGHGREESRNRAERKGENEERKAGWRRMKEES